MSMTSKISFGTQFKAHIVANTSTLSSSKKSIVASRNTTIGFSPKDRVIFILRRSLFTFRPIYGLDENPEFSTVTETAVCTYLGTAVHDCTPYTRSLTCAE
jgi:hypothetical protein